MTDTQIEHVSHVDWTAVSPPIAVVEALAETTGQASDELATLYEYVDPDALEALVTSRQSGDGPAITFQYDSHLVTVEGSGTITIESHD